MSRQYNNNSEPKQFEERILQLRRVSKKTSGGNYVSFSALVAIGDGKGKVGIGIGRGLEVPPAIQKAIAKAKKSMITVPLRNDTIPHRVLLKFKASRLLLKPAPPGTGLKVGGVVRIILDIAGVQNASAKIMGTRNKIANAYTVMKAIKMMRPRIHTEPKVEPLTETVESVVKQEKIIEEKVPVKDKKSTTPRKKSSVKKEIVK